MRIYVGLVIWILWCQIGVAQDFIAPSIYTLPDTVSIERFIIAGNNRISNETILKLTRIDTSVRYRADSLIKLCYKDMQQIVSANIVRRVKVELINNPIRSGELTVIYTVREPFPITAGAGVQFIERNATEWWKNGAEIERVSFQTEFRLNSSSKNAATSLLRLGIGYNPAFGVSHIVPFFKKANSIGYEVHIDWAAFRDFNSNFSDNLRPETFRTTDIQYSYINALAGVSAQVDEFSRMSLFSKVQFESIGDSLKAVNPNYIGGKSNRLSLSFVPIFKFNRKSAVFHPDYQTLFIVRSEFQIQPQHLEKGNVIFDAFIKRIHSYNRWQWEGKIDLNYQFGNHIGFTDVLPNTLDYIPLRTLDNVRWASNWNTVFRQEFRYKIFAYKTEILHTPLPFTMNLAVFSDVARTQFLNGKQGVFSSIGGGLVFQLPFGFSIRTYYAFSSEYKSAIFLYFE